jgi:hypothetical protein
VVSAVVRNWLMIVPFNPMRADPFGRMRFRIAKSLPTAPWKVAVAPLGRKSITPVLELSNGVQFTTALLLFTVMTSVFGAGDARSALPATTCMDPRKAPEKSCACACACPAGAAIPMTVPSAQESSSLARFRRSHADDALGWVRSDVIGRSLARNPL